MWAQQLSWHPLPADDSENKQCQFESITCCTMPVCTCCDLVCECEFVASRLAVNTAGARCWKQWVMHDTTDAHHICYNRNSKQDPVEDTIDCEHTCRNCVHADRSDWLNSYGTFQPMGPNLRRSCTMECKKHITKRSCRQSCLFTASSISCRYRPSSGISNVSRKLYKCLCDKTSDDNT